MVIMLENDMLSMSESILISFSVTLFFYFIKKEIRPIRELTVATNSISKLNFFLINQLIKSCCWWTPSHKNQDCTSP